MSLEWRQSLGSHAWVSLTCSSYKVSVEMISKRECWLELKWHVETDIVKSVESQNQELGKETNRRENVSRGCKWGHKDVARHRTKWHQRVLEIKAETHSRPPWVGRSALCQEWNRWGVQLFLLVMLACSFVGLASLVQAASLMMLLVLETQAESLTCQLHLALDCGVKNGCIHH